MPMQWNEQADAKLFANVLRLHVVKLDYQALAKAMGETVTPKAISHRISKIKEKAQVRRLDWEIYSNPPTSCAPKRRGAKTKLADDEDGSAKKRIKVEVKAIKTEETSYDSEHGIDPIARSAEEYFWPSRWVTAPEQLPQNYEHCALEGGETSKTGDLEYDGVGGGSNASADSAHVNAEGHVDSESVATM